MGLKRVGLLGLRPTMEGEFYPEAFSKMGIGLVVPSAEDREYVHDKYLKRAGARKFSGGDAGRHSCCHWPNEATAGY